MTCNATNCTQRASFADKVTMRCEGDVCEQSCSFGKDYCSMSCPPGVKTCIQVGHAGYRESTIMRCDGEVCHQTCTSKDGCNMMCSANAKKCHQTCSSGTCIHKCDAANCTLSCLGAACIAGESTTSKSTTPKSTIPNKRSGTGLQVRPNLLWILMLTFVFYMLMLTFVFYY